MCGIAAFWSRTKVVERSRMQAALRTIHHRGPDEQGLWYSQNNQLALGHVRLSIIDLLTGTQPLHSQNNQIHAVVNGEFYDFEAIRQDLKLKGYVFKTLSDSEILIALYQEYGTKCLTHLRGEFAFVLYDETKDYIFAARDRFGIKPLFYSLVNQQLYFASEAKALFALGVKASWDLETVHSLENQLPRQAKSIFKNVEAIKPGHFIIATPEGVQSHCYWDMQYPKQDELDRDISDKEWIEAFRARLSQAIKLRLRSDVPVGCYLSGGLDSCSVLGLMSEIRGRGLDAFTLSFDHPTFDEADIAKETSDFLGTNHHVYNITSEMLRDHFNEALYHSESFIFNNNTVAKFMLSKYTQEQGYKVILTGEGADEMLAGYPVFREDVLNDDDSSQDVKEREALKKALYQSNQASRGLFHADGEGLDFSDIDKALGYVPSMLKVSSVRGLKLHQLKQDRFQKLYQGHNPFNAFMQTLNSAQLDNINVLNKSLYLWIKSALPGYILIQLGDRMEMAHSLEGRVPFLDHHLAEFVAKVPTSLKIKGMTEKYILREAVKDKITPTIYERQKHPFLAPPSNHSDNPFLALMQDVFHSDALKHHPLYSQKQVLKLFKETQQLSQEKRQVMDNLFMHVLSACQLQALFKPDAEALDIEAEHVARTQLAGVTV